MKTYSPTLREKMLKKMLAPNAKPISELAVDSGISAGTLYTWKARAARVPDMSTPKCPRRPDDWSLDEKICALAEASSVAGPDLGEFLRRKGLHEADLQRWRQQVAGVLGKSKAKKGQGKNPEAKRLKELERELRRKDKALAEAAALLVLKKKARAIWGDEDDDTTNGSGR